MCFVQLKRKQALDQESVCKQQQAGMFLFCVVLISVLAYCSLSEVFHTSWNLGEAPALPQVWTTQNLCRKCYFISFAVCKGTYTSFLTFMFGWVKIHCIVAGSQMDFLFMSRMQQQRQAPLLTPYEVNVSHRAAEQLLLCLGTGLLEKKYCCLLMSLKSKHREHEMREGRA